MGLPMAGALVLGLPSGTILTAVAIAVMLAVVVATVAWRRALTRKRPSRAAKTPATAREPAAPPDPEQTAAALAAPGCNTLDGPVVFAKLYELALGAVDERALLSARHQAIAAATVAALHDGATQQRYAPRRPNMLPRLMNAATDESSSRRELASIVARDPALVGSLLKIANSSFYRVTPEPIESIDRALALLGPDGLRSMISTALMQPIFRIAGASFPRFPQIAWEHTFRAASAAVPYAVIAERSDPFAAELLSLLMGLAGIVIFRVAVDQYAKEPEVFPDAGVIGSLLDSQTASVARRIGSSWELSEPTLAALDGQTSAATALPTPLGRALHYGRIVGALAVLRMNHLIATEVAWASIPPCAMPAAQIERMWARLTVETKT
jgi:HD-like signal output (HDOD) protein